MIRKEVELDHIDPRWKKGRDYQLVCGLNCALNLREEDWKRNSSKSNRFLPWRWAREEIGVVPEEPGDLALFLVGADIEKDTPGEWVLMEFMSPEWYEATKYTFGAGRRTQTRREELLEQLDRARKDFLAKNPTFYQDRSQKMQEEGVYSRIFPQTLGKYLRENPDHQKYAFSKLLEKNPNHQSEAGSIGGSVRASQEDFKQMSKNNLGKMNDVFYVDPDHPELGVCRPGLLVRRQKKHGYPHGKENRVRIE